MQTILKTALLVSAAVISAGAANAATILTFGQASNASAFTGTKTGDNFTLSANNLAINITQILDASNSISSANAFLNLTATNTNAATTIGAFVTEAFSGSFSITSMMNGAGTDYLSGTFGAMEFGSGSSATLQNSSTNTVTFLSSVITALGAPQGIALSFANVTPSLGQCGTTLCSFSSSVSGTFSATAAVPEPTSWAMMVGGFGLLGATLRRKRTNAVVNFG